MNLRILSAADVRQALPMAEAVEAIKAAFAQLSTGRAEVPLRTLLEVPAHNGVTLFMPACLAGAYAGEMEDRLSLPVKVAGSSAEALRQADVVCTATTPSAPVFSDADLKPGVHINAVGAYTPQMQELPPDTVARAQLVIDHYESSLAEAGDLIIPLEQGLIKKDHIYAELGEIAAGLKPGRRSDEAVTLFKSVGVAVQDVAAAGRVLAAAERLGLGVEVAL